MIVFDDALKCFQSLIHRFYFLSNYFKKNFGLTVNIYRRPSETLATSVYLRGSNILKI